MKKPFMKKSAFSLCQEAEGKGLSVSMTNIVDRTRTDKNKELSNYFKEVMPSFKAYYGEDEWEEVVEGLNAYIEEHVPSMQKMGLVGSNESEVYLVPITERLALKVILFDEYYGQGEYSTGVNLDRFLITEEAEKADVDALVAILQHYRKN